MAHNKLRTAAFGCVVFFGFVSLFADFAYEGARSIIGQYLLFLGASGFWVGFIAGAGELVNTGFRFIFGYLSDRLRRHWAIAFFGYFLTVLAVPALAFATSWQQAGMLVILEKLGKAIRTPSRDTLLSYAAHQTGRGTGFGLHEALDRTGAIVGPLVMGCFLIHNTNMPTAFLFLGIPALFALIFLAATWLRYPEPEHFEEATLVQETGPARLPRRFWLSIVAFALIGAGYVDFPLIAYHFQKSHIVDLPFIPFIYAMAMVLAAAGAFIFGRLYDTKGIRMYSVVALVTAFFAPCVFAPSVPFLSFGVLLWGVGLGAQQAVIRSYIADIVDKPNRATAYGVFYTFFGLFWFLGSALMGYLYDINQGALVAFSLGAQLLAALLLLKLH